MSSRAPSAKAVTRRVVRRQRAARGPSAAAAAETALAAHAGALLGLLGLPADGAGEPDGTGDPGRRATVAAYASLPGEPGTGRLREELRRLGHPVLLPVLLPDRDLDWVLDQGPGAGAGVPTDPLHPSGDRLGHEALAGCALVLLPALAVDASGTRLGQGGGSYDRALARLGDAPSRPLLLAVVHDDEVRPRAALPREPHDVGVDGWLTPSGPRLLTR